MQSDNLEDVVIKHLDECFGSAVQDYVVKESTDTPFLQLTIEMTIYNYLIVRLKVERNTIFFSVVQSSVQLHLFKVPINECDWKEVTALLDKEVRLRITDKYLLEKGW